MQKFAEYFDVYLHEHQIPYKRAAILCEIDRTLLRRYAKGTRIPKSEETVIKIAEGLSMKEEDKERLCMAYRRTRIGERQYQMNIILKKIREGNSYPKEKKHGKKENLRAGANMRPEKEMAENLKEKKSIETYLSYVLWGAEYAMISLNPLCSGAIEILMDVLEKNPGCSVEHIIGNSSFYGKDNIGDVKNFEVVFPLLLVGENYRVFHHYRWNGAIEAEKSELNLILTDKGIVLFDLELSHGVFSNQNQYLQYYLQVYRNIQKNCSLFAENRNIGQGNPDTAATMEIVCQNNKAEIEIILRADGRKAALIRRAWPCRKEIYLEEEGIVHLVENYLV